MKKTLIVAAVSALAAGTAFAQSSVTIYGRFNVSGEYQENIGAVNGKQYVLQNSASRIGFIGVEDLGGGLKAGFNLEHGFNADTGAATSTAFWARGAEVNLGGRWGMVRLGTFTSEAYYATADYVSMHNHDTGTSEDKLYAYLPNNTNKIAYRFPGFIKDMSLEVAVSAGENRGPKAVDAAWNWKIGGLALGAGYQKVDDYGTAPTAEQYALRALWEIGPFILGGYWQHDTNGTGGGRNPDGTTFGDRDSYRLSGAWNIGSSEFHLNYGWADNYDNVRVLDKASRLFVRTDSKASQYTVGYNYNLSKRTKLYAFYTKVDNSDNYSYFGAIDGNGKALDPSAMAFGIRHNF